MSPLNDGQKAMKYIAWSFGIAVAILVISFFALLTFAKQIEPEPTPEPVHQTADGMEFCTLDSVVCDGEENAKILYPKTIKAYVTAYNTTSSQTDDTPCISASNDNICGRTDVAACPRNISLGTQIRVGDRDYVCLDRLHPRYTDRFDISFDKDIEGAKEFGKQYLEVTIWQ
jgi:3D (Asp-Asp-Asp) domain-containing protein